MAITNDDPALSETLALEDSGKTGILIDGEEQRREQHQHHSDDNGEEAKQGLLIIEDASPLSDTEGGEDNDKHGDDKRSGRVVRIVSAKGQGQNERASVGYRSSVASE